MTTEDLDRSDTRRPWTRPTLRRLSSGGQAGIGPTLPLYVETTISTSNGNLYLFGPLSG